MLYTLSSATATNTMLRCARRVGTRAERGGTRGHRRAPRQAWVTSHGVGRRLTAHEMVRVGVEFGVEEEGDVGERKVRTRYLQAWGG